MLNGLKWVGRKSIFLLMCLTIVYLLVCCIRVIQLNEVKTEAEMEVETEIETKTEFGEEELLHVETQHEEKSYFSLKSDQLLMKRYEEVLNTCVTIRCGGYRGEGSIFFIEEEVMYIVSVKHLLKNDTIAEITTYDGIVLQGEVVYLSQQYDFGFVRIVDIDEELNTCGVVTLPVKNQLTYSHYLVIATINGQGREETLVGTVLDPNKFFPEFNSFLIHHYCLVEPGMSGSGVFNEKGEYQGILVGGLEQESVSLSYEYVKEEFELWLKE